MTPESVIDLGQHALYVTLMLLMELLLPALAVGLIVSIFQAATQINEMTLSFIPKLIVTMLVIVMAGPWMLRTLVTYTQRLIEDIPGLLGYRYAMEMIIGGMIGVAVAVIFNALITGGQLIAQTMGLGFAPMMDPQNGVAVPVIGQFYTIMATLLFLAMNGHLLLIEMVANSFHSLPVGAELSRGVLLDFVLWGKWLFIGARMIAMPAVVALLIVNIAFGVMTRA